MSIGPNPYHCTPIQRWENKRKARRILEESDALFFNCLFIGFCCFVFGSFFLMPFTHLGKVLQTSSFFLITYICGFLAVVWLENDQKNQQVGRPKPHPLRHGNRHQNDINCFTMRSNRPVVTYCHKSWSHGVSRILNSKFTLQYKYVMHCHTICTRTCIDELPFSYE